MFLKMRNCPIPYNLPFTILILGAIADIDECTEDSNTCAANAKCINTVSPYDCECHDGFSGDGHACTGRK